MKKYKYIIFLSVLILFTDCDLEKFTGYDYDAPPIPNSARIYGQLTNTFTGEPVEKATIKITEQATFSDENGEYEFYYYLGEDDPRNKPNRMIISAPQYTTIDTMIVIFPENKISKKLEYAAPIIKRIALVGGVCQAEIYDYQGYENISEVNGKFYYMRPTERVPSLITLHALTRVAVDSPNTGYYQTIVPTELPDYGLLLFTFKIYARDRQAYSDSISNTENGVDSLFIPEIR